MEHHETFLEKALANWIYVIFKVERTLREVQCQMCGKVFKKNLVITERLQQKHNFCFVLY